MNKLLIVLLAVCLVSVHAFVKRDATEPPKTDFGMDAMKKNFEDFSKNMNTEMQKVFDPEKMKKNFNEFIDKAFDGIKDKPK